MRLLPSTVVTVVTVILAASSPAPAEPGKPKPLTMTDPDTGHVVYADTCSNGRNADAANRTKYIAKMLANKESKLAKLKATLENDGDSFTMTIGDWVQTYNEREGCGELSQSYSAFVFTHGTTSNEHLLYTKFLVTIDDEVAGPERTFSVRSIQPVAVR